MSPKKYFYILLFLSSNICFAQSFLGISSSNYGGTNALFLNPANVSDSRSKLFINLGGIGAELQNDYARWAAPYDMLQLFTRTVPGKYKLTSSDKPLWRPEYYQLAQNGDGFSAFINAEVRGPAVQYSIPEKGMGIAAGLRLRLFSSLSNNTSDEIGEMILRGTKYVAPSSPFYENSNFLLNTGLYNEYFLTIGKNIIDDDSRFLKIGLTAKRFTSNLQMSIEGKNLDYVVSEDPFDPKKQSITLTESHGTFTNADWIFTPSVGWLYNQLNNIRGEGNGFGADIGFVYEYRPDHMKYRYRYRGQVFADPQKNKYKWKFGVAITDIGYLKFNTIKGEVNDVFNIINPGDFKKIKSPTDFISRIEKLYNLNPGIYDRGYTVYMPATVISNFDYKIREGFYFTAIWRQRIFNQNRVGPLNYSGINLIPRFERKYLEFSFPISLENDYKNLNLGATMRAGPFYLGFDNFTGLFRYGKPRGLSVYSGLFLPLYYGLPSNPLKCYFEEKHFSKNRKSKFKK